MNWRPLEQTALVLLSGLYALVGGWSAGQVPQPGHAGTLSPPPASGPAGLEKLLKQLGDQRYAVRERATRALLALGPELAGWLRARLERERDPEVCHRLRYILESIVPPRRAALLLRADPDSGLEPGDLITHVDSQRVRSAAELQRRLGGPSAESMLRVRRRGRPLAVGPLTPAGPLLACDYAAPRGELIARIVRLYADGLAERAYELLSGMEPDIPESELPLLLRARIAYTAGAAAAALGLLAGRASAAAPAQPGNQWQTPSQLDLAGPGKAPLALEWALLTAGGQTLYATRGDPDIRVQRVLVPAHRYRDALRASARLWWTRYRDHLGADPDDDRKAGNMLAVAAWMLHQLDLQSECARLVAPRSRILGYTWIRVQTDAWLPFLAGDAGGALERFYPDARRVIQRPFPAGDPRAVTRNAQVAARLAFFLYQFPQDRRVTEMRDLINYPGHSSLPSYAYWMLYALRQGNQAAIRRDLLAMLPNLTGRQAPALIRAAALLEYVQNVPDRALTRALRQQLASAAEGDSARLTAALLEALAHLGAGRAPAARDALAGFPDQPELSALRHTAEFLSDPPATAANHPLLAAGKGRPLLAVPLGAGRRRWLVLGRDRRLWRFDAPAGVLTPVPPPTPSWFPGPLNWPWIGREESSGLVWVYGRRRLLALDPQAEPVLRLNIRPQDVAAFDRYVGPVFSTLARALAARPPQTGEAGEFLRAEIRANGEYAADPELPEIGFIRPLARQPRIVHVAFRGGPDLLIDSARRRAWSSSWIAARLGLDAGLRFFPQALPAAQPAAGDPPVVILMSDRGLIRFDLARQTLRRIRLPGPQPFPALIPESAPYERRDPRYVYFARLPRDGGQVYRLLVSESRLEAVRMTNIVLPPRYAEMFSRAALRADVDRGFRSAGLPGLEEFVRDAAQTVARWQARRSP